MKTNILVVKDVPGCLDCLGESLRTFYLQHGTFEGVEMEVAKMSQQKASNRVDGGWHTEISLKETLKWTEYFSSTKRSTDLFVIGIATKRYNCLICGSPTLASMANAHVHCI